MWREALAEADGDDELVAWIRFELGEFLRFTEGVDAALAELRAAVEAAERAGDDVLTCRALGAHALVHFNSGRGSTETGWTAHSSSRRAAARSSCAPRRSSCTSSSGRARSSGARAELQRWAAWARPRGHAELGEVAGTARCSSGATGTGPSPGRKPQLR